MLEREREGIAKAKAELAMAAQALLSGLCGSLRMGLEFLPGRLLDSEPGRMKCYALFSRF
jgi:hypothetical protein